jgi:hypothetical protein
MAVSIQELEVVAPPSQGLPEAKRAAQTQQQSGPPNPELERRLEQGARLRRSRDLRLKAD